MLPTNFAASRAKYPELATVFDALADWIRANPHLPYMEVSRFRRTAPHLGRAQLAVALAALVEDGVFGERIAVEAPTNHALALTDDGRTTGLYESEDEIPDELFDTALTPFETDQGELVPVYQGAEHD
jgi:hypothetical protein